MANGMIKILEKNKFFTVLCAAFIYIGGHDMSLGSNPIADVQNLVSRITSANIRTKDKLEDALGVNLERNGENSAFSMWKSHSTTVYGIAIKEISYRQPHPGGQATSGSILIVSVDHTQCIEKEPLLRIYPSMVNAGPPPAGNPEPIQYYSQNMSDASLSLGFETNEPQCLREIVYSFRRP